MNKQSLSKYILIRGSAMQLISIKDDNYQKIVQAIDETSGLNAVICVHRFINSRSAGGCRMWTYDSHEAMLKQAKRLSKAMTYKAVFSDMAFGGAKAVMLGDPSKDKTPELYQAMGKFVDTFKGQFYTGKDVGTTLDDVDEMKKYTRFVSDRNFISGNSSLFTAYGLYQGLQSAVKAANLDLNNCRIGLQGAGAVARYTLLGFPEDPYYKIGLERFNGLLQHCKEILICDINPSMIDKIKQALPEKTQARLTVIKPEEILEHQMDIFMPCALGKVLTPDNTVKLKSNGVQIIAGCANSQLPFDPENHSIFDEADQAIWDEDILYMPDYAINAGGLIAIGYEIEQNLDNKEFNLNEVLTKVESIQPRLDEVIRLAKEKNKPTGYIADLMAEEKMKATEL